MKILTRTQVLTKYCGGSLRVCIRRLPKCNRAEAEAAQKEKQTERASSCSSREWLGKLQYLWACICKPQSDVQAHCSNRTCLETMMYLVHVLTSLGIPGAMCVH